MHILVPLISTIFLLLSEARARPTDQDIKPPDTLTLRPIPLPQYEVASGLRRRDSESFADLDPETQHKLIYGSPGYEGQTVLAQMDLTAPDGLLIVLMEKFERLTREIDCNDDDGLLSMTFTDSQTYDYATSTWSYINEDAHKQFLLITNHAGCSPDDQRQPYYISQVDDEPEKQRVVLHAEIAEWSDITGTYDLTWGQATPEQHRRLKRRDFWDDVADGLDDAWKATSGAVTDVVDKITDAGTYDQKKVYTFGVAAGNPGVKSEIFKDPTGHLTLNCLDCYVTGKFIVTGHVKVKQYQPQEISLSAQPQAFQAQLKLQAVINAATTPAALAKEIEIISYPIPYAGIAVPNVFKLGAILNYAVGFSTTFKGRSIVDFGLYTKLPDTGMVNLVIAGSTPSSATGFETSVLTPFHQLETFSASVTLAGYSKPAINFGLELDNIGKAKVQLSMHLPEVSSTLTASYSAAGVCPTDTTKQVYGVNLSNQVKLGLNVAANAELGPLVPANWGKELWSKTWPLPGRCWPITFPIDVT